MLYIYIYHVKKFSIEFNAFENLRNSYSSVCISEKVYKMMFRRNHLRKVIRFQNKQSFVDVERIQVEDKNTKQFWEIFQRDSRDLFELREAIPIFVAGFFSNI